MASPASLPVVKPRPFITANQVTFLRLALIPIPCWMLYQGHHAQVYSIIIATILGSTDFVDGYLARKYGPTKLGGLMDPIADKVFVAVTFIPALQQLPISWWFVMALFVREFLVTAARTSYEKRDLSLKSTYLARYKTWTQMCGVAFLFLFSILDQRGMTIFFGSLMMTALIGFLIIFAITRKPWKGAGWYFLSAIFLVAGQHFGGTPFMRVALLYFIVGVTWASGLGYLSNVGQLRGRGPVTAGEIIRLATSVALPILIVLLAAPGMHQGEAPKWALIALVSIELAHGGLDNLLAAYHAESGALEWGGRLLLECGLLGAALVAPAGFSQDVACIAALVVALLGLTFSAIQKRRYYLDETVGREPALSANPNL